MGRVVGVVVVALVVAAVAAAGTSTPFSSARVGDPSGAPMPLGNLPGWTEIFSDDFTTSVPLGSFPGAVSGKWSAYPYPWKGSPASGTYDPARTVTIHGGVMDIWLHTEMINRVATHLIAAVEPKINGPNAGHNQLYGRYVIRYEEPTSFPMFHWSWLLWPKSGTWPRDGEIDFPEMDSDSGSTSAFMHWLNATSGSTADRYKVRVPAYGAWHTAVIEWLPGRCSFILDGKLVGQSTSHIPDTPMHWVIQNGVSPHKGPPPNSTQGHIYIDWVAVYRPNQPTLRKHTST